MDELIKLPASFDECRACSPLGSASRLAPVALAARADPSDPAQAWFDAATVASVVSSIADFLKG